MRANHPAPVIRELRDHHCPAPGTDQTECLDRAEKPLNDVAVIPAEAAQEPVLTVEEVAERFNVSTKTISRWGRQGLVGRRFVMHGRSRIGFLQSSIERFVARNRERVRRGAKFSRLTDQQRARIIHRARQMARAGKWPADVARQLARELGRSAETIRYTLQRFDRENPGAAVFPHFQRPLAPETKQDIYRRHLRGESVDTLAKCFYRSKSSIHRLLVEMRAQQILQLSLDYVPNEAFLRIGSRQQEEEIIAPAPRADQTTRTPRPPSGLPSYLKSLYEFPLLTKEQEVHLFRKMNYLKFKAARLRAKLNPSRPKRRLMDQIRRCYDRALVTKNEIIQANLRLVVSIAKRHLSPTQSLFELISDGNLSLVRAVELFDYSRGNKFSTYATWAIIKNFARTIPEGLRHRDRFPTGRVELLATAVDERSDQLGQELAQGKRESRIEKMLQSLDGREREIIVQRFGLQRDREPLTLKQVGVNLGVTKERIRQLEARAMDKLRRAAEIGAPGPSGSA
jgi:RNA polymerase primary sigma factor